MREFPRAFFRKYSQFLISLLFAGAAALLGFHHFLPAYMLFSVSGAWALVYWQASDYLSSKLANLRQRRQKFQDKPKQYRAVDAYRKAQRSYWVPNILGSLAIIGLVVVCLFWTSSTQTEYQLEQWQGWLVPANDPDPPSFCSAPKDALRIFIGRNEAFSTGFPFVVLRVHGTDRIAIDRDATGRIALSVDILDSEGKVLVTFEKGHFTVAQRRILDIKRPDRSTLVVRDENKNEVLNVRYLNKRSIQFSGLLRYPQIAPIAIPKASAVSGVCVGGFGAAAYAID